MTDIQFITNSNLFEGVHYVDIRGIRRYGYAFKIAARANQRKDIFKAIASCYEILDKAIQERASAENCYSVVVFHKSELFTNIFDEVVQSQDGSFVVAGTVAIITDADKGIAI